MEEPDFGKGVAQLLSLTREKGSLYAADKEPFSLVNDNNKRERFFICCI